MSYATILNEKTSIFSNPDVLAEENEVIEKYGRIFHPSRLDSLTKEEFKSFLIIKNNKHWTGIHRQGNIITKDMVRLHDALRILLDESRDIKDRLNELVPRNGTNYIKGLGRAILTPILMVVYPNKYGVYNKKSENGLKSLGLLPNQRKVTFGEEYSTINEILNSLAKEHKLSLWWLDSILGRITGEMMETPTNEGEEEAFETVAPEQCGLFSLESHLEGFLVENWGELALGKNYAILEEDGDITGQQFRTPIGPIDILAINKDNTEWLIIELKKGKSDDRVVGQILRYIGWVKENLAKEGQTVKGLIIVGERSEQLRYSLKTLPNVSLMTYSVNFQLKDVG